MAFKENPNLLGAPTAIQGILDAKWVGLKHFETIFRNPQFLNAFSNTLIISFLKIAIIFPLPIALAIVMSEMRNRVLKRGLQISMYLPYFLSWAIIGGVFTAILNKNTGMVNNFADLLGFSRMEYVANNDTFRGLLVLTQAWKDLGWSTITYLAAITALDPGLEEAAKMDGASKWQQIRHVVLPGILPTVAVMFILRIGYIMDAGFEQVFVFYSPFVQQNGDILGMYTYRLIRQAALVPQYSLSTAIGLFNSAVALILVLAGNAISRKLFDRGIW
ncbi:MAG: ABC transporter permease subunit [Eubacteriales bacterium]|nr:ABC transporter permease subunit [Eubacteriales bacterium]